MNDLYAAYGSNLDHARMTGRCPGSTPAGVFLLPGWRLVLRRYADIARDPSATLPLGLWRIRPAHLPKLDLVEGVAVGAYVRTRIATPLGEAWIYEGRRLRPGPPEPWYVTHLRRGYRDFHLDEEPLESALAAAGFADRDSRRVM